MLVIRLYKWKELAPISVLITTYNRHHHQDNRRRLLTLNWVSCLVCLIGFSLSERYSHYFSGREKESDIKWKNTVKYGNYVRSKSSFFLTLWTVKNFTCWHDPERHILRWHDHKSTIFERWALLIKSSVIRLFDNIVYLK